MRIREVLAEHQFQEWQYGDGYTEPLEWGAGCTCNVVYDQGMQHACSDDCSCRTTDPVNLPEAHLQHVLAMLIRARLLRSDGAEVVTNVPRQWGGAPIQSDHPF